MTFLTKIRKNWKKIQPVLIQKCEESNQLINKLIKDVKNMSVKYEYAKENDDITELDIIINEKIEDHKTIHEFISEGIKNYKLIYEVIFEGLYIGLFESIDDSLRSIVDQIKITGYFPNIFLNHCDGSYNQIVLLEKIEGF